MAVSVVQSDTQDNGGVSTALNGFTFPSAITPNNVVYLALYVSSKTATDDIVSTYGYTSIGAVETGVVALRRFYKVAGANEDETIDVTLSGSVRAHLWGIECSGVDTSNVLDSAAGDTEFWTSGAVSKVLGPGSNVVVADSLAIAGVGLHGAGTNFAFSGFDTKLADLNRGSFAYEPGLAAAATISTTISWTTSNLGVAFLDVLRAAPPASSAVPFRGYPRALTRGSRR